MLEIPFWAKNAIARRGRCRIAVLASQAIVLVRVCEEDSRDGGDLSRGWNKPRARWRQVEKEEQQQKAGPVGPVWCRLRRQHGVQEALQWKRSPPQRVVCKRAENRGGTVGRKICACACVCREHRGWRASAHRGIYDIPYGIYYIFYCSATVYWY